MAFPSNDPLFIVGVHRSGTTLLRYMLSSSPRIYIPPESDFIPRFFMGRPARPLTEKDVVNMLRVIFSQYRFVKAWQGDAPSAESILREMEAPTPAAFLDALYSRYARQYGAVRWGDKTPIYASYIDLIHQIFPRAQFIHLIRDGRDAALSMLEKWERKEIHVDIFFAARNWVRRIQVAQAAGRRLGPEKYYELYYEDLVRMPEQELRRLCRFLAEPYVPEMVEQQRLAREQLPAGGFHEPVRHPPTEGRIGRWREKMRPTDVRLFQAVAGDLLQELGYELAPMEPMLATEVARMTALATKYAGLQAGRRLLQAAGVMPPI
ncbi:MAG: sulfotransferase family protein [Chloroflexota bacterium]